MPSPHGRPPDDPSSAPESGTERDPTSGNQPSDRANDPRDPGRRATPAGQGQPSDDPSTAGEER